MGIVLSRKLRRKLAARLKELGYGKLYTGSKHKAYKWYNKFNVEALLRYIEVRPGVVINDCDGLNHRVVATPMYRLLGVYDGVLNGSKYEFADGHVSCGCGQVEPPRSYEAIRSYFVAYWSHQQKTANGRSWLPAEEDSAYQKWKRGEEWEVCDKDGMPL